MTVARTHHTATLLIGAAVLIAGGIGPSGPLASAELYNPAIRDFQSYRVDGDCPRLSHRDQSAQW